MPKGENTMTRDHLSPLCQCLCLEKPRLPFVRLLAELEQIATDHLARTCRTLWDEDDHARLEIGGYVVLLHWSAPADLGLAGVMTVAVTPPQSGPHPKARLLLAALVHHLQDRIEVDRNLWRQLRGVITADRLDDLAGALPAQPAKPFPGVLTQLRRVA